MAGTDIDSWRTLPEEERGCFLCCNIRAISRDTGVWWKAHFLQIDIFQMTVIVDFVTLYYAGEDCAVLLKTSVNVASIWVGLERERWCEIKQYVRYPLTCGLIKMHGKLTEIFRNKKNRLIILN